MGNKSKTKIELTKLNISLVELFKAYQDVFIGVHDFMQFVLDSKIRLFFTKKPEESQRKELFHIGKESEDEWEGENTDFDLQEFEFDQEKLLNSWQCYKSEFMSFFISYMNNSTEELKKIFAYIPVYGEPDKEGVSDHIFTEQVYLEEVYVKRDEFDKLILENFNFQVNVTFLGNSFRRAMIQLSKNNTYFEDYKERQALVLSHLYQNHKEGKVEAFDLSNLEESISDDHKKRGSIFKDKMILFLILQDQGLKFRPNVSIT